MLAMSFVTIMYVILLLNLCNCPKIATYQSGFWPQFGITSVLDYIQQTGMHLQNTINRSPKLDGSKFENS